MKAFHISLVWTNKVSPSFIMSAIWRKGRRYFINFLSNAVVCLIFYCLIRIKKFKIHPLRNTGTYISETINCRAVFMMTFSSLFTFLVLQQSIYMVRDCFKFTLQTLGTSQKFQTVDICCILKLFTGIEVFSKYRTLNLI